MFFRIILFSFALLSLLALGNPKIKKLPFRSNERPKTTSGVPHKQIGVRVVPKIYQNLIKKTFAISKVVKGPSFTPYPEAIGILLAQGVVAKHPKALLSGRDFAHFHPDGSLHLSLPLPLPLDLALEAVKKGWAVRHPWAQEREGWEGLILVYTPITQEESDIVFRLIVESIEFMSGKIGD